VSMRYRDRRQAGVQERESLAEWRFSEPLVNLKPEDSPTEFFSRLLEEAQVDVLLRTRNRTFDVGLLRVDFHNCF
jgi:hypothetical protein